MSAPVTVIKEKGLQIAVWEAKNGGYSFSISKRYKDKATDQWKDSKYFYKEDLEKLGAMIEAALGYATDRAEHQNAAIESGALNTQQAVKSESVDFDDDMIPF